MTNEAAASRTMFRCRTCGEALNDSDFHESGLRAPDHGESLDEYCDAELVDEFEHVECLRAGRGRAP